MISPDAMLVNAKIVCVLKMHRVAMLLGTRNAQCNARLAARTVGRMDVLQVPYPVVMGAHAKRRSVPRILRVAARNGTLAVLFCV